MAKNYKCVLSGKCCPFSEADFLYGYGENCPIGRYKNADYSVGVQTYSDEVCRYHGIGRYERIKRFEFLDGGREDKIPYDRDS